MVRWPMQRRCNLTRMDGCMAKIGRRAEGDVAIPHEDPARNTVAIVGDSPVICHAIAHIIESGGHQTRILGGARQDEAELAGVSLVLVAGTSAGENEPAWWTMDVPMLRLVDTPSQKEPLGETAILWPCPARQLQAVVSSALGSHRTTGIG